MNSGHGISTREREDTEQIQDPTQSDLINSSHDTMRVARHNNAISADAMALDVSNMLDNITTRLRRDVMEAVCAVRTASTKYMDTLMEDERQIASNRISALQEEVVQLQAKLEQMEISQALSRQQFEKAIQRCGSQRQCVARRDFHRLILSSWRDYARKRCSLRHRLQFYRTYHQQAVSRRVIQEWRLITQSRKIRRLESHQALLVEEHARQLHAYLLDRVAKSENEIASLKRQLIQEQEKTHELQNRCTGDVLRSVAMLHHEAIALFRPKTVEGGRKIGPEEECRNEDPKRDLRAHRVACGGSSNTSHQVFAEQSIMEDDRTALNATRAHTEDAESSVTSHYPGVGKVGRNFGGKHSKLWTDETIHGLSRMMWRAPLTPTPSVGGRVAWSVVEENEQLSPEQAIDSVTHPYSFTQSASGNSGTTLALHPKQTDSFQETSHARIQNGHHDPTQVQPVQSKSTRGREEGMCRSSNQSSTKDTANKTRSALHGRSSSQSLTSRNMKSCVPRVTLNPNHPLIKMRQNHLRSTLQ